MAEMRSATIVSFIVIPDTQMLAKHYPDIYLRMSHSIVEHVKELRASAVLHLGDVVDGGGQDEMQYRRAASALQPLYEAGIPLLIAPGNHDYDVPIISSNGRVTDNGRRQLSMFNQYFGLRRFQHEPWFGGVYEEGKAENMYALLESGGASMLIIILEFAPRNTVMTWADQVLRAHPDRQAIVITHSYMYMYGERIQQEDPANPRTKYFDTDDCNDGEQMWQKHLKHHPNLAAVFSGHHIPVTVSYRDDQGVQGNRVAQFFQNWQDEEYGGSGRYRIVQLDTASKRMRIRVFNPLSGQFEVEPGYEWNELHSIIS